MISVIHAALGAVEPLNEAFQRLAPGTAVRNFINEELLARANAVGRVDATCLRSFARTLFLAAEAGAEGIVVACSAYGPYAQEMAMFLDVPIIAIDQPMLRAAVEQGSRIGILTTNLPAASAAQKQMEQQAAALNRKVSFVQGPVLEAAAALAAKDQAAFCRLLKEQSERLIAQGCDLLILAQITMACAAPEINPLGVPVLTSPDEGVRCMMELVRKNKNGK